MTIPISVTQLPLLTVEDFENEQIAFSSGTYLNVFRTNAGQYVQRGHHAGKLDYTLTEDTGWFATASGSGFSNLEKPYTALNLWVYGDASGNQLSLLYTDGTMNGLRLPGDAAGLHRLEAGQRYAAAGIYAQRLGCECAARC